MLQASKAVNVRISIHAPREGGDFQHVPHRLSRL